MYHNEKGEGFTGKLATFATFAGITAIALGSAPTIGRSLGRIGVSLAKDIADNPSMFKSVLGHGSGLNESKHVFSDVFNFIADELPRLDNVIYSGNAHTTRMESMLDSLASHVDEASQDIFKSKRGEIGDALHSLVKGVEKDNIDKLMSDTLFNRFIESSQGVQFKFMDQKAATAGEKILKQRQELTQILSGALERAETARFTASRTSKQILNTDNNLNVVMDAVHSHVDQLESIGLRNHRWMGDQGLTRLTIGDITMGGDAHDAVTEYLKKIGVDHEYHGKAHQSLLGFMDELDFSTLGANAKSDLISKIHSLDSGLVMDKGGKVFSMAHPFNIAKATASRTLQNFQIPLVPGVFNIPGTLGKFMAPDLEGIKYLGKMGMQGELRRAGALSGLSEDAFGVAIGDRLIAFDGDTAKHINIKANFINTSASEHAKEFARSRGQDVEDLFGSFKDSVDDDGILKAAWNYVKKNDEHSHTFLQKTLFGRQNELFDLAYTDNGFTLVPKNNIGDAGVAAALHSVGKLSGLDSSAINPILMSRFLENGGVENLPGSALQDAYRQVFTHASAANVDSSAFLKQAADKLNFDSYGEYGSQIQELLKNSNDPAALLHAITTDSGNGSLLDNYSTISKNISPELSRAIAAVGENSDRLMQIGPNPSGLFDKLRDGVIGTDTLSSLHLQLQKGLVSETVRLSGINELTTLSGKSLNETLDILHTNSDPALRRAVAEKLGLKSSSDIGSIIDTLKEGLGSDTYGDIGRLVSPMADFESLFGMSNEPLVKAKIAEAARVDSVLAAYYSKNYESHSKIMEGLARGANVSEAVAKRFGLGGANFTPAEFDNVPKFYATIKTGDFGPVEPGFGFLNQLKDYASSINAGSFARGLVDPNEPMSHAGFVTNILMHMPQSVGNAVGLGLSSQEGLTVGRSVAGFAVKRVLPAFVALEIYKNYNADMHNMGMPGVDDMAGNAYANVGLAKARVFDALGLTGALKGLVGAVPGLDQYGHPKSEEEFNEELFYGDEAVRRGRFFVIGSRTPFTGGAVEYLRPNFYRRMKAHWTEASNVQLSNPKYSFLPTITNPLAPINRLLHSDWQEELTEEDRPYMTGNQLHEFLNNQHPGVYFENAPVGGDGNIGYISYGAGLPTTVKAFRGLSGGFSGAGGPGGPDSGFGGSTGFSGGSGGGSGGNTLGNAYYEPGTAKIKIGNRKDIPVDALERDGLLSYLGSMGEEATRHMGLYGGILRNSPLKYEHEGIEVQDPEVAFSNKRLFFSGEFGELTGPVGEFYRRFISEEHQSFDAFNPLPNRMPSWVPQRFRTGDPYMRVSHGEFNLPGDAYERLHPYTRPLKARGSMIGLEKDEIVAKMLDPVGAYESESAEDIMGYGTATHKRIMRQLSKTGMMVGAEVAGYDPVHNISATIETVMRGQSGLEVVEIKTRGNETFNTDPEKYVDQLMFYMYLTGAKQGKIAHVNRDNPNQVRFATYKYDENRMQAVFERVEEARGEIREMVEKGIVSPYETYDLLSRIEILAKTAPDSPEFREYVHHAQTKGGFGGMEQVRFERAIKSAQLLREDFNIYPYRNVPTETRAARVRGFTDEGEIVTNMGVIKLAGVKWDKQAFTMQDPEDLMSQYGIVAGKSINITLPQGGFNPEVMEDVTTSALVGNVNSRLIHSQYADPDYADKSAMGSLARQDKLNSLLEKLLHSDNVISNKWLRVRSGLEQFERGEVFGTENQSYRDLWGNYIEPTFNMVVSKNPITAALQGGIVTSFFVKGRAAKGKAALIGGAVAGLISTGRLAYQAVTGETQVPHRYRAQTEFDEYYDLLNYIKQASLGASAQNHVYKKDKTMKDQLDYSNVSRTREQVDAFGVLALEAERKARQTMYGFDVVKGTLQDALAAIPRRHRQIAESVIVDGTQSEKAKFYNLLPNSERRVLGKFLGKPQSSLPSKPSLNNYFKNHFLPDADWLGWHRNVDLEDIKTRAAALEKMKIDQPSRSRVSKARAYTRDIPVPKMHSSSHSSISGLLQRLSASGNIGSTRFTTSYLPTTESAVTVNMKFIDQNTQKTDEQITSLL